MYFYLLISLYNLSITVTNQQLTKLLKINSPLSQAGKGQFLHTICWGNSNIWRMKDLLEIMPSLSWLTLGLEWLMDRQAQLGLYI